MEKREIKDKGEEKFWFKKITDNIKRDKLVTECLRRAGWKVLRFWDFSIKSDSMACARKIAYALGG